MRKKTYEDLIVILSEIGCGINDTRTALSPCPDEGDLAAYIVQLRKPRRHIKNDNALIDAHLVECNSCFQAISDALNALTLLEIEKERTISLPFTLLNKTIQFLTSVPPSQPVLATVAREQESFYHPVPMQSGADMIIGDLKVTMQAKIIKGKFSVSVAVRNIPLKAPSADVLIRILSDKHDPLLEQKTNDKGRAVFTFIPNGDYVLQILA